MSGGRPVRWGSPTMVRAVNSVEYSNRRLRHRAGPRICAEMARCREAPINPTRLRSAPGPTITTPGRAAGRSQRRKIAIASWRPSRDGRIYTRMELEATPMLRYAELLSASSGVRVTLTHVVGGFGQPGFPLGGAFISNVGSLGLDEGFLAPLPCARWPRSGVRCSPSRPRWRPTRHETACPARDTGSECGRGGHRWRCGDRRRMISDTRGPPESDE